MYNISANTIFTGKILVYLTTCHSTNEYASRLIADSAPIEGTLVITPEQTNGKGQRGASWESETGKNLTFSLILKPSFLALSHQFFLNVISSLAVRDTVAHFLQTEVKVKWPNDIYLNDNKLAGILIQNTIKKDRFGYSIMGIGLNINQTIFSDKKAISMKNHTSQEYSVEAVLNNLLSSIESYYLRLRNNELEALNELYIAHLYRVGEEHSYKTAHDTFRGVLKGIDESGNLKIESEGLVRVFSFKEVEFL